MFSIRTVGQLTLAKQREALALLFSGLTGHELDANIERAQAALRDGILDSSAVFTGWIDKQIVGVLVAEVLPGSSASLWPIRSLPVPEQTVVEDALFSGAIRLLLARGVRFAQTILSADNDPACAALCRNGFRRIASVWNMRADFPVALPPSSADLRMEPLSDHITSTFQHILMDTFEATQDAPELNGLRSAEEIIAGHVGASPDLSRWWLAHWKGRPAGVLILADGIVPELHDLAYFGVIPALRGHGIGRAIFTFSLEYSAKSGASGMTLLVDDRNQPAIRLYEDASFRTTSVRDVFIRALQLT